LPAQTVDLSSSSSATLLNLVLDILPRRAQYIKDLTIDEHPRHDGRARRGEGCVQNDEISKAVFQFARLKAQDSTPFDDLRDALFGIVVVDCPFIKRLTLVPASTFSVGSALSGTVTALLRSLTSSSVQSLNLSLPPGLSDHAGIYGQLLDGLSGLRELEVSAPFDHGDAGPSLSAALFATQLGVPTNLTSLSLLEVDCRLLPFISFSSPLTTLKIGMRRPTSWDMVRNLLSSVATSLEKLTEEEVLPRGQFDIEQSTVTNTTLSFPRLRRLSLLDLHSPLLLTDLCCFPALDYLYLDTWDSPLSPLLSFIESSSTLRTIQCSQRVIIFGEGAEEEERTAREVEEQLVAVQQVCDARGIAVEMPYIEVLDPYLEYDEY
jgi:hypothetical protein